MKRDIITIDEEKCNGCGDCVPSCPEGAIQIIDGKARLISDLFCDGLGACIGECPTGALKIEKREAEAYNEREVMKNIIKQGPNVIKAHLQHLVEHGENDLYDQAIQFLEQEGLNKEYYVNHDMDKGNLHPHNGGCPGAKMLDFREILSEENNIKPAGSMPSELRQWPIQMHLISPIASYFKDADVVIAADCVAYAMGDFHVRYLKGKALAVACPKLDSGQEIYIEKITRMIDEANINTISVLIMEVPCCGGLLHIVKEAISKSKRKVPLKAILVSLKGEKLQEEWV